MILKTNYKLLNSFPTQSSREIELLKRVHVSRLKRFSEGKANKKQFCTREKCKENKNVELASFREVAGGGRRVVANDFGFKFYLLSVFLL